MKPHPAATVRSTYRSSKPALVLVLEAEDAIKKWRDTMGATNPADGTIRKLFAASELL